MEIDKQTVIEAEAKLIKVIQETVRRTKSTNIVLKPYPPASQQMIEKYERYLELKLPPSYRFFLELHNGYECLAFPGHMLSIESLMPGQQWHKKVIEWKQINADTGGS